MKIAIVYPPFEKNGKIPLLTQNRHFRYSSSKKIRIFPLIPSSGATLLKRSGHDVLFLDYTGSSHPMDAFIREVSAFHPDVVLMETKAPVIRDHWRLIDSFKNSSDCVVVLAGDHVSYFPEESLRESLADYCLTGGDYDLSILQLVNALEKKGGLPGGVYYRKSGSIESSGPPHFLEDLDTLPFIDRDLTHWSSYGEAYLYSPCAYILSGRGCGTRKKFNGRCGFCIWQFSLWKGTARLRSPENVAEEIEVLTRKYRVSEIFDDNESGAIWNTEWLDKFHAELNRLKILGKVHISSNARGDCLDKETCILLKRTGYRLLKVGLESGNNATLERLRKDETVEEIVQGVKNAKDAGLNVMLTVMTGFPWEKEKDAGETYNLAHKLLLYKTRAGDCVEASIFIPYPGTPLYRLIRRNGWLRIGDKDYEKYDVSEPIVSSPIDPFDWCGKIWRLHLHPLYIAKSIFSLRRQKDLSLAMKGLLSLFGHLKDF